MKPMITPFHLVRPLLFRLDPERAHELALRLLRASERIVARHDVWPLPWTDERLRQELWGLRFSNPVGLAAGFDKNAVAPHVWPLLGFGLIELGTVTAAAQPGNPRPRMFRLERDRGVINRLGFNNIGADAVVENLEPLLRMRRCPVPVGLNIGKSRVTPVEAAVGDYLYSFRRLFLLGDYFVVNVSSPNTPGLRDLQAEEHLRALLGAMAEENQKLARLHGRPQRPVLVKVAPDLSEAGLRSIVDSVRATDTAGLVATNTTLDRSALTTASGENGGLSGAPLRQRARAVIATLRSLAGRDLPIIGVGGISSAEDAYGHVRAGASLVQIYTGLVFEGPFLARRIARGLSRLLQRDGYAHLRDAVGADVK
jgi:dihydroorotate dehydrogenase